MYYEFFVYSFIKALKIWESESKSDSMEMAYSAERSIQDEIEDLSTSTVGTVAISYTVMFVYVTLSLGKWTNFRDILVNKTALLGNFIIFFLKVKTDERMRAR